MRIAAIILAAGSGTRLNAGQPSEKPKVLYEILGKPMISYTVELLDSLNINEQVMVVGYKAELIKEIFADKVKFALQEPRLGTAHAAKMGEEKVDPGFTHILIIQGDDSAFYKKETLERFITASGNYKISFTTVCLEDPGAFGRVLRDERGEVVAVVEKEAATEEQKKINEVNAAAYFVERDWFNANYSKLKPSKVGKGEIIMPDLIKAAFDQNEKVLGFAVPNNEWVGVNTPEELQKANKLMKERSNGT